MNKKFKLFSALTAIIITCAPTFGLDQEYFDKLNSEIIISDADITWNQFAVGNAGYSECFFTHPTDPNTIFNFPDMGNSYRSTDGGKSFHTILDSDAINKTIHTKVYGLDFSRQNESFGMSANGGGIRITKDKGATWSDPVLFGNMETVTVDPNNDAIWFAGSGDFGNDKKNYRTASNPHGVSPSNAGKLYKTTDSGKTWHRLTNTGIHPKAEFGKIYIYPGDSNLMITTTTYGLYISKNAGNTWNKIESIEPSNGDNFDLVADMDIYEDPETGKLTIFIIHQVEYAPDPVTKTIAYKGGILKSHDLGNSWININGDLGLDLEALHNETFKLVTETLIPNNIPFLGNENFVKSQFNTNTNKFLQGSLPPGQNLNSLAPNLPTDFIHNFTKIEVDPTNPNKIYLAHNAKHTTSMFIGDVWSTADGGKHWHIPIRTGLAWQYPSEYWDSKNQPMGKNVEPDHYTDVYGNELYTNSGARDLDIDSEGNVYVLYRSLYKSTDDGESWDNIDSTQTPLGGWVGSGGSNLPGKQIITDIRDPEMLLMVGGENRLFARVPDGDTVYPGATAMYNYTDSPDNISMITVSPDNVNEMYALILRQEGQGEFFKSTDKGASWNSISRIFTTPNIHTKVVQKGLIIDPENTANIYFGVSATNVNEVPPLHSTKYSGVYKSTDKGLTWNKSNQGLPATYDVYDLEFSPQNSAHIFAGISAGNPIPISNNNFNSNNTNGWTIVGADAENTAYVSANSYGDKAVVLDGSNIGITRQIDGLLPNTKYYLSANAEADPGNTAELYVESIDGTSMGATSIFNQSVDIEGMFFTTGPQQTSITIGAKKVTGTNRVSLDNITLLTAGGLYESTDHGTTWSEVSGFPEVAQVNNIVSDPNNGKIYVTAGNERSATKLGGAWVSADNGKSWEKIFEQGKTVALKVDPYNSNRILLQTRENNVLYKAVNVGIFYSDDAGTTWSKINQGIGNMGQIYDLSFDPSPDHPETIWMTSSAGGFFKGTIAK